MVAIPEKLVFMDVETTGLDPKDDRIIEVYLLALSRSGEVSEYETLLNPGRPIPERITELTGLTDAAVAAAPREEE
ncbi:MAG TPA: 3'-5' exonuclease, partial [Firmicutes bacterium]|nr:3'-5' exonuclease [Bacillota bacterium]